MSEKKLENEIIDYIAKAKLAIIATVKDGGVPALRTVGSFAPDGLTVYFSTGKDTEKVKQIEKNQNVAVFFQHEGQERGKFRYVSITGVARQLAEKSSLDQAISVLSARNPNFKQRVEKGEIDKIAIFKIEPRSIKDLDYSRGAGPQAVQTLSI